MTNTNQLPEINLDKRLYLRPKEVEEIFGIKQSTLRRQRTGRYGFPFTVVRRAPQTNKGGTIFYAVEDIKKGKFKFPEKKKNANK